MNVPGSPSQGGDDSAGGERGPSASARMGGRHAGALDAIAIKVVDAANAASGNARALLHELEKRLEAFVERGVASSIDLRSLPLSRGDYDALRAALGTGAVAARVDAIGPSDLRETRYPGVWWITHFNEAGEIVADLIEISPVPQILVAPSQDVADGLSAFKSALAHPY